MGQVPERCRLVKRLCRCKLNQISWRKWFRRLLRVWNKGVTLSQKRNNFHTTYLVLMTRCLQNEAPLSTSHLSYRQSPVQAMLGCTHAVFVTMTASHKYGRNAEPPVKTHQIKCMDNPLLPELWIVTMMCRWPPKIFRLDWIATLGMVWDWCPQCISCSSHILLPLTATQCDRRYRRDYSIWWDS